MHTLAEHQDAVEENHAAHQEQGASNTDSLIHQVEEDSEDDMSSATGYATSSYEEQPDDEDGDRRTTNDESSEAEGTVIKEQRSETEIMLDDLRISPPYSIEEVAAELLSLYQFMVRMYLPDNAIMIPPPGGWPGINATTLARLGKSPAALELLRHLPYLKEDDGEMQIYYNGVCKNFAGSTLQRSLRYSPNHFECEGDAPSHLIYLGGRVGVNGADIIFDARTGQVRRSWWIRNARRKFRDVKHFCKVMKRELIDLRAMPFSPAQIEYGLNHPGEEIKDEAIAMVKDMYLAHDWPSEAYRKRDCQIAIGQALEAIDYPWLGEDFWPID